MPPPFINNHETIQPFGWPQSPRSMVISPTLCPSDREAHFLQPPGGTSTGSEAVSTPQASLVPPEWRIYIDSQPTELNTGPD